MSVPISNVTRRVVLAASGTGPYSFNFEILAATDIAVYRDDTLLTLTTDYTVTINTNGTGYVTLNATPTGATQIAIVGDRAIQRTSDFVTGGDLFANTLNSELDSLTIFAQQNAEATNRSLKAPQTDPTTVDMTLPKKADRANKALTFDADGNAAASVPAFPGTLTATNIPRVNSGGTAYELRTPAQTRADIGADNASNLTSGTVADARLPSTLDGKTLTNATLSSPTMTTPALGTPSSATLTNATGLPLTTGVTGTLPVANGGTGVTSSTGSGSVVLSNSPALTTPNLGTPSAATLTNATGLPLSTGVTGTLPVGSGGTGQTSYTDGQLLIGNTATGGLSKATLTAGSNVTITNGNGTITIASTGGGGGGGSGDVVGPASATDNAIVRYDGTTGKLVQNSAVTIDDTTGSLNFTATGARITGDFSNATQTNRVLFQSSTTNGVTNVGLIPNGTSTSSQFTAFSAPDATNASVGALLNSGAEVSLRSSITGTGTYLPMTFYTNNAERMRIDTDGNVEVKGSSTQAGTLRLYEDTDNGTNYVSVAAPASVASNVSFTLPSADGTNGQALTTNGSGVLAFATVGGGTPTTNTYDTGTAATWTKPSSANWVLIEIWGGGGSGGFGGAGGGGGGGGGGAYNFGLFKFSDLQGAVTYTVGAGGASRATAGDGNAGGTTSVDMATFAGGGTKTIYAYGGGPGQGSTSAGVGGGGGGIYSSGSLVTLGCTLYGLGGSPSFTATERNDNPGFGGANGGRNTTTPAGNSVYGGAGGGFGSGTNAGTVGGDSVYGGAGGGAGEDTGTGRAGGTSIFGGNGSAGTTGTTGSAAGATPSGGSGGTENAASGAGGGGRVRFTYW